MSFAECGWAYHFTESKSSLQLPSMLWKMLVGQTVDLSDVSEIDFDCGAIKRIRAVGKNVKPLAGRASVASRHSY